MNVTSRVALIYSWPLMDPRIWEAGTARQASTAWDWQAGDKAEMAKTFSPVSCDDDQFSGVRARKSPYTNGVSFSKINTYTILPLFFKFAPFDSAFFSVALCFPSPERLRVQISSRIWFWGSWRHGCACPLVSFAVQRVRKLCQYWIPSLWLVPCTTRSSFSQDIKSSTGPTPRVWRIFRIGMRLACMYSTPCQNLDGSRTKLLTTGVREI